MTCIKRKVYNNSVTSKITTPLKGRQLRRAFFLLFFLTLLLTLISPALAQKQAEDPLKHVIVTTEDFRFIYRAKYRHLVPGVVVYAQTALQTLKEVFNYTPTEKIDILIEDSRDIGSAGASTFPHNRVRLEIAPYSIDYEFSRFDRQIQWLLSHELVHIVISDQASPFQRTARKLFRKVAPEPAEPLSLPFSLLTSPNRYTPLWHQEGIAVFMETWLNGGFGRVLGSFDEMYFRTMVKEDAPFTSKAKNDYGDDDSFLLGTTSYLYGARFVTWLSLRETPGKLFDWFTTGSVKGKGHLHFKKKFKILYGFTIEEAWKRFLQDERSFQKQNLERIRKYPLTPVRPLHGPMGWVTRGQLDASGKYLIFANHRPHELAGIKKLHIETGKVTELHTLPTPDLVGVASTAFDPGFGFFFYTTHNNRGYRDLWALDVETRETRLIFKNMRLGELTVNGADHALWGVMVDNGRSYLSISTYPYRQLTPLIRLEPGVILAHLAVSPNGKWMAASLHQEPGSQEIIVIDLERLRKEKRLFYRTVSAVGGPEHPSWGPEGKVLYWNAYISGVSNIFCKPVEAGKEEAEIEALSNVETGLFHPRVLDRERLIAFDFTSRGFRPCILPLRPAPGVAAIHYYGQQVIEKFPELEKLRLVTPEKELQKAADTIREKEKPYRGFFSMGPSTFIPTVNAFEKQVVFGAYAEMADALFYHRLVGRFGYSPSREEFHLDMSYTFKDTFTLRLSHSPASFYDLVNRFYANSGGTRARLEFKKWHVYRMPSTLEQWFYLEWGKGLIAADRLEGEVNEGEVLRVGTRLYGAHRRRTIGSVDYEHGYQWNLDAAYVQSTGDLNLHGYYLQGDASWLRTFLWPHNIVRFQCSAGVAGGDELSPARFYFGGFGNLGLQAGQPNLYRQVWSLPGLDKKRHPADRFVKLSLENLLPPLDISRAWGPFYLGKMALSLFGQYVILENNGVGERYLGLGAQLNLRFQLFYGIQSTLSLGYAHAWDSHSRDFDEVFVSLKLFR